MTGKTKKIYVLGIIDENTVQKVYEQISEIKPQLDTIDKIYLFIDSDGGIVSSTGKILNLLEPIKEKLTTVALTSCKSCATFLFLLGKERLVIEECEFLMHRPAVKVEELEKEYGGRITVPALKEHLLSLKDTEEKLKSFYKEHNVPNDLLKRIFTTNNDVIVSAESLLLTKMATAICKVDFDVII